MMLKSNSSASASVKLKFKCLAGNVVLNASSERRDRLRLRETGQFQFSNLKSIQNSQIQHTG